MNKFSKIVLTIVVALNSSTALYADEEKKEQIGSTQNIKAKNVEIISSSNQKDVVVKVVKSGDWLTNFSLNCKIFSESLKGGSSAVMGMVFTGLAIYTPFMEIDKNSKILSFGFCALVAGICAVESLKAFSKARITDRKKNKARISLEVQKN
jgi:hypothetical protein